MRAKFEYSAAGPEMGPSGPPGWLHKLRSLLQTPQINFRPTDTPSDLPHPSTRTRSRGSAAIPRGTWFESQMGQQEVRSAILGARVSAVTPRTGRD